MNKILVISSPFELKPSMLIILTSSGSAILKFGVVMVRYARPLAKFFRGVDAATVCLVASVDNEHVKLLVPRCEPHRRRVVISPKPIPVMAPSIADHGRRSVGDGGGTCPPHFQAGGTA